MSDSKRGPMGANEIKQIQRMHGQGTAVELLAAQFGRTTAAIQRAIDGQTRYTPGKALAPSRPAKTTGTDFGALVAALGGPERVRLTFKGTFSVEMK